MKKILLSLMSMAVCMTLSACNPTGLFGGSANNSGNENGENTNSGENGENGGGGVSGDDLTPEQIAEKGYALKITLGEYEYAIYTAKGKNARVDKFYVNSDNSIDHTVYVYQYTDKNNRHGYEYYKSWDDVDYSKAAQETSQFYVHYVQDASEIFCAKGYSKTGTEEIAGKKCDVYSGKLNLNGGRGYSNYMDLGKDGISGSFAVWKGLTLKTVCEGEVQSLCTKLVIGTIPDSAFSKTLNTDWIK